MSGDTSDSRRGKEFRPLVLIQLGLIMVSSLLLSLLLGLWIDSRLNTQPWATLFFMLVGVAAGSVGVYRLITSVLEDLGRR